MIASIQLAGGPYALAQVYAWAGMLVSYSQTDGLAKAAVDTFSGDKPCELCCKISEAKQDDAKKPTPGSPELSAAFKLRHDLFPADPIFLKAPVGTDCPVIVPFPPARLAGIGLQAPLLPPPRIA